MAESQHDGGPAFPTDSDRVESPFTKAYPGMTLRDYFAAKAMAGMLANTDAEDEKLHARGLFAEQLALNAYGFADAMLKARKQEAA